jgi:hypothetical protein
MFSTAWPGIPSSNGGSANAAKVRNMYVLSLRVYCRSGPCAGVPLRSWGGLGFSNSPLKPLGACLLLTMCYLASFRLSNTQLANQAPRQPGRAQQLRSVVMKPGPGASAVAVWNLLDAQLHSQSAE